MKGFLSVFIWAAVGLSLTEQKALDDYIRHYEEVNLDREVIHRDHSRVRRSLDSHLYLRFKAFKQDFHLKLEKESTVFSPTHEGYNDHGHLQPIDTSFVYQGKVIGKPRSFVHMSIINGTVRGHIDLPETTYHIEPADQYFHKPHFHSVVYDERDVNLDPYRHKREAEKASCGNDVHFNWMKDVSESAYEPHNRAKRTAGQFTQSSHYYNKYTEFANREKRSNTPTNLGTKNTCYLYLRSDPMLWDYIKHKKYPGDALTDERVKEEILAFFASHVVALKAIYSKTTFETYDKSLSYNGINFLVQRTKIMTDESEKCGTQGQTAWCNPNIDVSNFLNLNSMENHDDFCLAYVFTYRDFTQGTLGLAWVGSETKAAGGICEKYKEYPEGTKRVKKSLNTGIVTIVNYGKQVQSRVSQLTFAHEVGHNFGSPHDKGPTCAPYGTNQPDASDGNYIMFASATMGDKVHNDEFSSCSKDNITRVLHAIVEQKYNKVNCFNSSQTAFCGNGIVETGETCDCGYESDCLNTDKCCYGKGATDGKECTLKPNAKCSPTAGPCCTKECEFFDLNTAVLCKKKDDCSQNSYCNVTSAECPDPVLEKNNTFCNSYSQVCLLGECRGSVCQRIDWEECFLTSAADGSGPSREELCFVSCRKTSTSPCVSSFNTNEINKPENSKFKELLEMVHQKQQNISGETMTAGIKLPAGSPCDNFRGYCDVFHRCRGVDADGPLARLKNLIFNPETLQSIRDWIVGHWWAVMLMGIGLVVVMGVFIKVCAVHTPSSNPRKPAARRLTLPRRHHGNQGPKPQARSVPVHDPPPPYSSAASSGPPPPGHGKNHHRHNNNKHGGKNNSRGQRYEMQPRA